MNRYRPIPAAAVLLASVVAATSAPAGAAPHSKIGLSAAREFAPRTLVVKLAGQAHGRAIELPPSVGVRQAAAALRQNHHVDYAAPDYIATASATKSTLAELEIPNDPGALTDTAPVLGGWVNKQWNFLPWQGQGTALLPTSPGGIDAVGAWRNLIAAGRPGARGVRIAILDTGVAYRSLGHTFRRSPDFGPNQFVKGYDFVGNDSLPLDENGHGTHVAGTIGEATNNGIGLTGLAYGAKLMPIRVLDRNGSGRADEIAAGIRYAVDHGADVINMSFNFGCGKPVPQVDEELRRAFKKRVVTVASIGNFGSEGCVSPPATGPHVIGVGGTTEGGCLGDYSLAGSGIDVVAPGGGSPATGCPSVSDAPIYQVTLAADSTVRFGEPGEYVGTSMAAAHVSGVAAMILASGVLTPRMLGPLRASAVLYRLRHTARSLGLPASEQGAGLIDAARATNPGM